MAKQKVRGNYMGKVTLTPDAVSNLQQLRTSYLDMFTFRTALRKRMEVIDRYVQRESDITQTGLEGRAVNRAGDKTKIGNHEVPVCFPQYDTAHAFLCGIFLTGSPIFSVVSAEDAFDAVKFQDPDQERQDLVEDENTSLMLSALCEQDQTRFGWVPELSKALQAGLRYNLQIVEATWVKKNVRTASRKAGASADDPVQTTVYEGNKIKYINPYNAFWDYTVDPSKVHEQGSFCGYVEAYNYIRLKEFLQDLDRNYAVFSNFNDAISTGGAMFSGINQFYTPRIRIDDVGYDPNNWSNFFGLQSMNGQGGSFGGRYEVCTMYAKIIPKEFGIYSASKSGTPAPWKLIYVGGLLVYAEPLNLPHEFLPMVFALPYDDGLGLQTKSFVENLMASQDIASSLMNATLASLRRAVSDRALYDPTRIRPQDVNSVNPSSKIPVTGLTVGKTLEEAYKAIPFQDTTYQFMQANMSSILQMARDINGVNQTAQGSFVKGNRTKEEFVTVQNRSDARQQKLALTLEGNFFGPLKTILLANYLMYAQAQTITSPSNGVAVQVDPGKMQEEIAEFEVSDGISPADKMMSADMLQVALQTIAQIPEMDMEYSRPQMVVGLLAAQGVDLRKYRRTQQEQQQYAAIQQAMAQNASGQKPPTGGAAPAAAAS